MRTVPSHHLHTPHSTPHSLLATMGALMSLAVCGSCTAINVCCSLAGCGCAACSGGGGQSVPTDLMVGKLRSLTLMIFSVVMGLLTQYYWAEKAAESLSAWSDGCLETDLKVCAGNAAIYRVSLVDVIFFSLMTLGAAAHSLFNNMCWMVKILLWTGLAIGSIFLDNSVFDGNYVWVARIGAFLFTILQQIVLIDMAYNCNDWMLAKADTSTSSRFLILLVSMSALLLCTSIVGIGVMYHYFLGCSANAWVLSLTLVLSIAAAVLQLSGEEGNLLTTSIVIFYAVFLAYSAVSKNPEAECNPYVGHEDNVAVVVVGLIITILSLIWLCANASTSITALLGGETPPTTKESAENAKAISSPTPGERPIISPERMERGGDNQLPPDAVEGAQGASALPQVDDRGDGWKLNVVLVLLSMYWGMLLTNWGVNQDAAAAAAAESGATVDPKNGTAALWLTASSQWVCLALYMWTLVAPYIFPDRDFS